MRHRIFASAFALLASASAFAECPSWTVPQPHFFTLATTTTTTDPVVAADLDGDGAADLVTFRLAIRIEYTRGGSGSVRETLQPQRLTTSLAIGDVNGDGRPDIVAGRSTAVDASSIDVFLRRDLGGFEYPLFVNAPALEKLALADLDGDGRLDIAMIAAASGEILTMLGDGRGGFGTPRHTGVTAPATLLVAADFNGDGKADLAVADAQNAEQAVRVYASDGTGGLKPYASAPVRASVTSLVAADFDRDGRADLAAASAGSTAIAVLRSTGSGFEETARLEVQGVPSQISVGDFDHDGAPDLAVRRGGGAAILLNAGGGRFRRAPDVLGTGWMVVADFTGDGLDDLLLSGSEQGMIEGLGNGTFAVDVQGPIAAPGFLRAADLDGDGDTDLVNLGYFVSPYRLTANILRNIDGRTFRSEPLLLDLDPKGGFRDLRIADLDGDGQPEILISAQRQSLRPGVAVIRMHNGVPSVDSYFEVDGPAPAIAVGDFDGDGRPELIMSKPGGKADVIAFRPQPVVIAQATLDEKAVIAAAADFDGDGRDDLVVYREGSFQDSKRLQDGYIAVLPAVAGGFGAPVEVVRDVDAFGAEVGDFDGDGRRDIRVEAAFYGIAYGDGGFSFDVRRFDDALRDELHVLGPVADLDGDGRDDVIGSHYALTVAFMGARGVPRRVAELPAYSYVVASPRVVPLAVLDVNEDGLPDIASVPGGLLTIYPGICGRGPTSRRRTFR